MSAALQRRAGILTQEAHDRTVLLRMEDGAYFALDAVGEEVWRRCDGTRDVEAIVAEVFALFDAEEAVIRSDVVAFVDEMVRERLLDRA